MLVTRGRERYSLRTRKLLDKLLRADHAKGLAAKCMYEGQLAVLNNGHVSEFKPLLLSESRNLYTTCFAFGIATAFLGEEAALVCKSAMEVAVSEIYNQQIRDLLADDPASHAELLEVRRPGSFSSPTPFLLNWQHENGWSGTTS
ncbi:unnamed protein product [Hydatigera taeniaeformis]|uniref:Uncharacterized protein n=1 Tax=Hydatigena taeniaeformis TaxID=6205 RepID=A0A3P7F9I2_HYDTA|nr:unnamed protein product [Hydatigera taeniaeformis]